MTRPSQHHTAPSGWINDPHGLVWHDGAYHLFFQHVPGQATWDVGCHWGHATSPDLLTWEPQPAALAPGDGDGGCWSGSLAGGLAFYTSVRAEDPDRGRVRRAAPTDGTWSTWTKQEVVVEPPPEATHFRDPSVRRERDGWRMLVGCATAEGPALWSYRSADLERWRPEGIVATRPGSEWTGRGWECPSLLEVGGRTVLVVSVWEPGTLHCVAYAVCSPDATGLRPGPFRRLSYGPCLYAAAPFTDRQGRPGLVAWLREVADPAAGWAGATSLPSLVSLRAGRLVLTPPAVTTTWAPAVGETRDGAGFALRARAGSILVAAGAHEVTVPWDGRPVRYLADGPVLEVYGGLGIAAVPLPRTTS